MIWVLLATLSSTSILVIFKLLQRYNIPTLQVIVMNYFAAGILGFTLAGDIPSISASETEWLIPASIIAVIFIVTFFLIAYSSQNIGISITSVAGKMSVIIPVVFSIVYYHESINFLKLFGIVLALAALFLSVYRKEKRKLELAGIVVPLLIFVLMGINDSIIKFSQEEYVPDDKASTFSAVLFTVAFALGFLYLLIKPKRFIPFLKPSLWIAGILLGTMNFGSIYFIFLALNSNVFASSIVFGVVNICVVGFSLIIGKFAFGESLTKLNILGVVLAVISILILMMGSF